MSSSPTTSRAVCSRWIAAAFLVAGCLAAAGLIIALSPSPAAAEIPVRIYYSDLLIDASPDPAFADSGGKTRRDVLSGVVGPETWVEHFVRGNEVIETLTYNDLTYGIVVKKMDGTTEYWALNDDRRTYTLSEGQSPSGWTVKNPPSYDQIIGKVEGLVNSSRFDDAITYITEVMRDAGVETAELYFYRGFSYDQISEFTYAKIDYRRAISLDSTIADAYFNLGLIYRNEGKPEEAVPLFERYLVLYPTDPNAESIRNYINTYR